ncbi:MAG: class I SAM-dependent RNA methyltransferase, partial [Bacilli bacterium]|nr:class I SAM-dependent RNA methyltransferase [Bacilli bacterium]
VKNQNPINYRNKVSLKIVDGKIGYYKSKTHELVEISECLVANQEINKIIKNYKFLNVQNGSLVIRVNSNKEVLLIVESASDNYNIEIDRLKELVKLVGIVYNNKTIYGDNFFYERIGGFLFKVSFNSFFQINHYICSLLFKFINEEISQNDTILDLYSGVGTLGIVASKKARKVISVEIVKNAVLNGIFNAKINKQNNIQFILGDTSKIVNKIKDDFDTLIIDPPRSGLDKNTISFIKNKLPKKIIYVSCDANTLMRDLKLLENNYEISNYKVLDMFSYSYHLESFVVLKIK